MKSNHFLDQDDAAAHLIKDQNAEQLAQRALEYGCDALDIERSTAPSGRQSAYLQVIEDLIILHIDRGLSSGSEVSQTSTRLFQSIDRLVEAYSLSATENFELASSQLN